MKKEEVEVTENTSCPIYEADENDWEDFWYNEDK
jgi:hypothetical protein